MNKVTTHSTANKTKHGTGAIMATDFTCIERQAHTSPTWCLFFSVVYPAVLPLGTPLPLYCLVIRR